MADQKPLGTFAKALRVGAVLVAVFLLYACLGAVAPRRSGFYLAVAAIGVLPVSCWRRRRFGLMCTLFIGVALALAASPIDLVVHSKGTFDVRILPASYGLVCLPGHACYGCLIPIYPVAAAVVVTF